jgi:hypothetical protein
VQRLADATMRALVELQKSVSRRAPTPGSTSKGKIKAQAAQRKRRGEAVVKRAKPAAAPQTLH